MASTYRMYIGMHSAARGATFEVKIESPDGAELPNAQFLEYESAGVQPPAGIWDVVFTHRRLFVTCNEYDQHIHYWLTLDPDDTTGHLRFTCTDYGSMWMVLKGEPSDGPKQVEVVNKTPGPLIPSKTWRWER